MTPVFYFDGPSLQNPRRYYLKWLGKKKSSFAVFAILIERTFLIIIRGWTPSTFFSRLFIPMPARVYYYIYFSKRHYIYFSSFQAWESSWWFKILMKGEVEIFITDEKVLIIDEFNFKRWRIEILRIKFTHRAFLSFVTVRNENFVAISTAMCLIMIIGKIWRTSKIWLFHIDGWHTSLNIWRLVLLENWNFRVLATIRARIECGSKPVKIRKRDSILLDILARYWEIRNVCITFSLYGDFLFIFLFFLVTLFRLKRQHYRRKRL